MGIYHSRHYTLNENFFDKWSPNMAYVLGFWFADGYMRVDKSYRVSFASNDKKILLDIRKALGSTNIIKSDARDNCFILTVHSKHLYEQLYSLGGHQRKSKTITFPSIPKSLYRDFIRGYFDGDGSVHLVTYRSTKNHKMRTELRSNFTSGCAVFLNQLKYFLHNELGMAIKKLGVYNKGASLKLGYGMRDTHKLLNYMYYSGYETGLARKAKFAKIFCSQTNKTPIKTFQLARLN
jgi:hypothetical protein